MASKYPNLTSSSSSSQPNQSTSLPIIDLNSMSPEEIRILSNAISNNNIVDIKCYDLNHAPVLSQRNVSTGLNQVQSNTATDEITLQRLQSQVKELQRMSDLGFSKQQQFRKIVRRIRMVYDSVRVLAAVEEENGVDVRRERSDLKASTVLKNHGLWLNCDKRIIGTIPGVCIGDVFLYKMELVVLGLHGQPEAGIDYLPGSMSSNGEPIATSVIVSDEYEDVIDLGDVIIYPGHDGGNKNSRQVFNEKLEGVNLAMERSMHYGIEVRVIRGVRYEGTSSTSGMVYVYDGLYRIIGNWFGVRKTGVCVYKFKLCRIDGQAKIGSLVMKEALVMKRDPFRYNPTRVLSLDISCGKEDITIILVNEIDKNKDPMYFEYLSKATISPAVFHHNERAATGCGCIGGCEDGCSCFIKNGNEFPYSKSGILLKGRSLLFECGPHCRCPPHCRNRVAQKGLKHRLGVFRSENSGWGVRSLDPIQAGSFICEYTGVVLTREQAQICSMNGDTLIYPNRFAKRWAEWGDLSLIDATYKRPPDASIPPLDFALDVSRMRNVACYMSHSPTPNVMVQFVLYDHNNEMFPRLMLFAMENIPPMRDLSLDYGIVR